MPFVKKAPRKGAALAGLVLSLWAGLLFISCPGPIDSVNAGQQILITSQADLEKIGVEASHPLSGNYLLENDITITDWLPIGDEAFPFSGVFDGNGRTITLNSFDASALLEKSYIGIFGYARGTSARAVIKNMTIVS